MTVGLRRNQIASPSAGEKDQTSYYAQCSRNNESRSPADNLRECAGDEGRRAEANAPRYAIHAKGTPAIPGVTDQPGSADRVVDRAKQPNRGETERQRYRPIGQSGSDCGAAGSDEEQDIIPSALHRSPSQPAGSAPNPN